jgi:hypothetical protein
VSYASLCPREERHNDKRNAGQNDARNTVLGSSPGPQIQERFIGDVRSDGQETDSDYLQRSVFVPFAVTHIRVNRHSPQKRCAARDLDKTVDSKPDQRNAARR